MTKYKDVNKRTLIVRLCLIFLMGAALFLLLILPLRGIMNAVNRIDFISQRLDDYPRMYATYLQETEEWWNWWLTEDYGKRAQQGAFIFSSDKSYSDETEKLAFIANTLGAENARVIMPDDYSSLQESEEAAGLNTCSAALRDGRLLVLSFHNSLKQDRMAYVANEDYFLSQLQAGLPGYICILKDDSLSIFPKDEQETDIRNKISEMLKSGRLNPEADFKAAAKNKASRASHNTKTTGVLAGKYLLYSAAYADNSDYVITVTEVSTLLRFARKRSWSLWFLCCAIMLLLGKCLWNTHLLPSGVSYENRYRLATKKGIPAIFTAAILIFFTVIVIQMLSGVNLSQQAATDQTEFLKKMLDQESQRADSITSEFDDMYLARAQMAASILSRNPQLIDADTLYHLNASLDGSCIRVFNSDGELLASDQLLRQAVDDRLATTVSYGNSLANSSNIGVMNQISAPDDPSTRYYHAVMNDDGGKTTGWVELCVLQEQLDELLHNSSLQEVIGDLHLLDTLHIVVAEPGTDRKIVAGTFKNWIGDSAEEHGIHSQLLFDGYEGIVSFEGNKCYSVVFDYGNNHVVVGSEDVTPLVFINGVLILAFLLILAMLLVVYRPVIRLICDYQSTSSAGIPGIHSARYEYPPLWEYICDFMFAVFLLSTFLYFFTNGDPAGLTYNIVRGTWNRGVNAATITTSIMLASVVFAVQRILDLALQHISKYMSPKGMTICRLIDSGFSYLGAIVMILYALSMFGVNTATLIGGMGVTALVFTLGANSLVADVVAGFFIIFEGDFIVGDVVVINDFRGIVIDIGMRTTKLMDDNSQDIRIFSNSSIRDLTNQSREKSVVIIDIPVNRSIGVERGEAILTQAIQELPKKHPNIIGTPEYWGISKLPEKNPYSGKLGGFKARIAFNCRENDKEMLTYQVYSSLVDLIAELNPAPPEPDENIETK